MTRIISYAALGTVLFAAHVQAAWKITTIDPGGGGKFTTLLFDKAGNAHVSYVDDKVHQLKYAFWDHLLHKWFVMPVDNNCDGFSSMALDSYQHPHISYQPYGTGGLKYANWDGHRWHIETIHIDAKAAEYYTSIALTPDDRPIITYYETIGALSVTFELHLRCVEWNGGYWQNSTIDWTPGSGKFNFLARGPEGQMAVAYADVKYEDSSLRFARWNGHSWQISILEGAQGPHPIYSVSMLLDRHNVPHIAYTDVQNHEIKYATQVHNTWKFEVAGQIEKEAFPDRNGIALAPDGTPYISYYDAGLGMLKLAHRGGTHWVSEIVDRNYSGFTSSIQIRDNRIVIVYFDSLTNSLKCASRALGVFPPDGANYTLSSSTRSRH